MQQLLTIMSLLICGSVYSQTLFEKTFGGNDIDRSTVGFEGSNGNYYLGGYTKSQGAGNLDGYLIALDAAGNFIADQTYGGTGLDDFFGIAEDDSNHLLLGGYTTSFGSGYQCYLAKTDMAGNSIWSKTYGGSGTDFALAVAATNNGYLLAGQSTSYGAGNYDLLAYKISAGGAIMWQKSYGGSSVDGFADMALTPDGGFVLVGHTVSFGNGGRDWYIVKADQNGNEQWKVVSGGANNDFARGVAVAPDSTIIVVGTESTIDDTAQLTVLKIDLAGNVLAHKHPISQGGAIPNDVVVNAAGELIIGGYTSTFQNQLQFMALRLSAAGDSLQQQNFGGAHADEGFDIIQTNDGGYMLSGFTEGFSNLSNDCYVVKTDNNLTLPCADSIIILADTLAVCEGEMLHFSSGTVSSASHTWLLNGQVAGTGRDLYAVMDQAGWNTLTLKVCSDSTNKYIHVFAQPDPTFEATINNLVSTFVLKDTAGIQSIIWNFGNGETDSINPYPLIAYTHGGQYTVSVKVWNKQGCMDASVQLIEVSDGAIGIDSAPTTPDFKIYPNPIEHSRILYISGMTGLKQIWLWAMDGQLVAELSLENAEWIIPELPAGIYHLQIKDRKGGVANTKLMIE